MKRIAHVIGGGIGGLAAGACLAQRGWQVTIHERSKELLRQFAELHARDNVREAFGRLAE